MNNAVYGRREGQKLFLKGSRCYSEKCSIARRNYGPGEHGQKRNKLSEYGTQLREKQKQKCIMELEKNNSENILKWLQTKKELLVKNY